MKGAPYLPTLKPQVELALDILDLKKGQTLLELGSGDGRVLIAAARRGLRAVGIELNPILVVVSLVRTYRYRRLVSVKWGSFYSVRWPGADGIFIFYLQKYMPKLDNLIVQKASKPTRLISFVFKIPNKKPLKQIGALTLYGYK